MLLLAFYVEVLVNVLSEWLGLKIIDNDFDDDVDLKYDLEK